jgi:hypothetical protein
MKTVQLAKKNIPGTLSRTHAASGNLTKCFLILGPNWREVKADVSCRNCLKAMIKEMRKAST